MKKSLLILAAATAVAFAACNGGNDEGSYSQAQVDSIAKVKSDSMAAAMKAQTDSTIAAKAAADARSADSLHVIDSIMASTKKTTTTTVVKKGGSKGTTTTTKTETKTEDPKKGGISGKSDQAKDQGGLKGKSDQAKQEAQTEHRGGLRSRSDQAKNQ